MPLRKSCVALVFGVLAAVPCIFAAQNSYTTGTFIDVQQKTRDKVVAMYVVNTPVTTAIPYFEISVELGNSDYVAEYTPRRSAAEWPEAWRAGEAVDGRVRKRHLFLKRPDGSEMQCLITKRTPAKEKPQR